MTLSRVFRGWRWLFFVIPAVLLLALCACNSGGDAAFGRYLQTDALPSDPSTRIQFGHGALPSDFPAGLPAPAHATLVGWQRTTTSTALSWEAIYETSGDASQLVSATIDKLKGGDWQVTDRSSQHGFQSLNVQGQGKLDGLTAVIAIGPGTRTGTAVQIEEIGKDQR